MAVEADNLEDIYELSPMQRGMLFHTLYAPHSGVYIEQAILGIQGSLNPGAFHESWQRVVARHATLRTAFLWEELDEPVQVVYQAVRVPWEHHDWRELAPTARQARLEEWLAADRMRGFDLARPPLLRLALLRIADETYYLLLTHHHLLLDGWSLNIVLQEVLSTYETLRRGAEPQFRSRRPYRDYIDWLHRQNLSEAETFWRTSLAGFTAPTPVLLDSLGYAGQEEEHGGSANPERDGAQGPGEKREFRLRGGRPVELQGFTLPRETTAALGAFARQHQITPNTLIQGAWALLLSRYGLGARHLPGSSSDVVFGATVAGRPADLSGADAMVGLFINTLPVRVQIDEQAHLLSWLKQLQAQQAEARQYDYTPLVQVHGWSEIPRGQPLFESLVVFENYHVEDWDDPRSEESGNLRVHALQSLEQTNYPLVLIVIPGVELEIQFGYETARFTPGAMRNALAALRIVLEGFLANPQARLADISLLNDAGRRQLLSRWNQAESTFTYPQDATPIQLFEEQVSRTPEAIAIVFEDQCLTYRDLDSRANQLAHYLRRFGVGPEVRVGLYMERSLDLVTGLLGILKAGGSYVPLDPGYPQERLAFMLADAQVGTTSPETRLGHMRDDMRRPLVLTQRRLLTHLPTPHARLVCIDNEWAAIEQESEEPSRSGILPGNAAYILYTSGSTGTPKGVVVAHQSLVHHCIAVGKSYGLQGDDRVLQFASISFDVAMEELFPAWLHGATVVIWPESTPPAPAEFSRFVATEQLTVLNLPSSYWHEWVSELTRSRVQRPTSVRCMIVGSEKVSPAHFHAWREAMGNGVSWYNAYGLTETTVTALIYAAPGSSRVGRGASIPIGCPIGNTRAYVLDAQLSPVPVGMPGELYVGGAGLARGYLHRPDLTAERFVPHPFSNVPGARLYRTGDLVRYAEDGNLEFLGRADTQVKLRGYRVEPGEIEDCIRQHAAVSDAVVMAREDTPNDTRLVAYIVPAQRNASPALTDRLRTYLQGRLPSYMVPTAFVLLDTFPHGPSGKVNYRALPAPGRVGTSPDATYIAPRTPVEELLANVWAAVLRLERVGRLDNFFKLGGHSLQATQVVARLREVLQVELPVRAIYDAPTISALASTVEKVRQSARRQAVAPIRSVGRKGPLPLSFAQQRLWFLDQLQPGSPLYSIPGAFSVRGVLDVGALEQSLGALVQRHEPLHTTFATHDEQPVQIIDPTLPLALPVIDLSQIADDRLREAEVERLAREESRRPFHLQYGPLVRATLLRLNAGEHVLLLTLHHIVADGWSAEIFFNELDAYYIARRTGTAVQLPDLPIQYADYAAWQQEWLQGEVLEQQLAFWREQLSGAPPLLELPLDHPRPAVQTFYGARYPFGLPPTLAAQLKALSQQEGVTLFMTLLAALPTLLSRYSGQTDIVIGTPIAGRAHIEVEQLIGFFVNTLVLRTDLSGNPRFREVLVRVREMALAAYTHQDLPFEKLVGELQPDRNLSQSPLFQVLFVLQNVSSDGASIHLPGHGLNLEQLEVSSGTAKFDLSFELIETPAGIEGYIEYNTDLFETATIQRIVGHYTTMLQNIVTDPDQQIATLPLLTPAERRQILEEWNDTSKSHPQNQCLHSLFEAQAAQTPDRVAVVSEDHQMTYQELNERANQLAHYLWGLGVGPESLVALCLERSLEMIIGVLGILKAGCAYVPIDPDAPAERVAFVLRDARATVLLTQQSLMERLPIEGVSVVCLDTGRPALAAQRTDNLYLSMQTTRLAYVIYTSGSTGRPKGVMVSHHEVGRLFASAQPGFQFGDQDRWTLFHSISFDFSVWELWGALLYGGRLVVVPYWQSRSPLDFLELLQREHITVLNQTPSAFRQLLGALPSTTDQDGLRLRLVIFGGEALDPQSLQPWFERQDTLSVRLVNMYGITETTVHVTAHTLSVEDAQHGGGSPIGRPLPDLQLYLLDAAGQPVPTGVTGEVYVGGAGLSRGYLGRPELTAERFVPHPFSSEPGARLYKSGDLARYLPGGQLEYLGRNDAQVKIRGFRIELGEIEAALEQHPQVSQAVVRVREQPGEERQLVAYVVPGAGPLPSPSGLRAFLSHRLPGYMLPAAFVLLEALPLTANGKLDLRALPAPDAGERTQGDGSTPAQTLAEEVLMAIWSDILHIDRVGVQDNFFDLGGHSLLATRMIGRVREAYRVDIPLRAVFEVPTLAELAARIEAARGDTFPAAEIPPLVPRQRGIPLPLSYAQERLWFLNQLAPESPAYNIPVALLVRGDLDRGALRESLNTLIKRHEALRTTFTVTDGVPRQVIAPLQHIDLQVRDLSGSSPEARQQELQRQATQEVSQPFDLSRGPLLRALLLQAGEGEQILLLTLHHSIADGWSTSILVDELSTLYRAAIARVPFSLPALPLQYADYALWQRQWLQGGVLEQQLAYWRAQLRGAPAVLDFPTDHPRPAGQSYRGNACFFAISPSLSRDLQALSRREATTLFMTLLAAFQVLLFRYSGQTDIVVGTPSAGRTRSEVEGLIGLFINTLALRADLSGNPSFRALLRRVREVCLQAYAHQDVPFGKVVEAVQPERSLSHHPLFQAMFILQNAPLGMHFLAPGYGESDALRPYPLVLGEAATKFDLTVELVEAPEGLHGMVEYNADLFEHETIERLMRHYTKLLEAIAADPDERLSSLALLDEDERRRLLFDWNATSSDDMPEVRVRQLFEEQVARGPDAIALLYEEENGERRTLTYAELNRRANRLARALRARGVKPEVAVGLYMERSPELIVGVLGILKAGGAYIPLDTTHPQERLALMLRETQAPVLLTQQRLLHRLPPYEGLALCLDGDREWFADEDAADPPLAVTAANLAYVIYTSGSTGRPKGVMITHGGLTNYLRWCISTYRVQEGQGSVLHSSLASDLAVTSLFAPLLVGQRLLLPPEEQGIDALGSALRQERDLSLVKLTPAHLTLLAEQLAAEDVAGRANAFIIGGEALLQEHVAIWQVRAPETRLINEYGPTETVVGCCVYELTRGDGRGATGAAVPIGRPIANTRLYLLDSEFRPVPIGVHGELYIAGAGVARGYLQRPDLTAERFLPDPFSSEPGARFYRTGDLARYLPDGNIEFLGRNDSQVKLRGYRVEPGEIEAALKEHPQVHEAVVLLEEGEPGSAGDKYLVACVVGQNDSPPAPRELRSYLHQRLPEYMVPAFYIVLNALPLLPNGKIDRRALSALRQSRREPVGVGQAAPRNQVEEALVSIWMRVLGREQVGIYDNFFDLGGHSLLITQVISRVREQLQVELPLRALFEKPTIADFAEAIIQQELEQADSDELMHILAELEGDR
jgi:amino acid adenylation domain-containing protein